MMSKMNGKKTDTQMFTTDLSITQYASHIQRIGCQAEKTTLYGGHFRSWSAEKGKKEIYASGSIGVLQVAGWQGALYSRVVVVVVVVFTLKTVLTSIQYPSLSYSSRQRNEFPWSHANPK